jgi:hypothetical protein
LVYRWADGIVRHEARIDRAEVGRTRCSGFHQLGADPAHSGRVVTSLEASAVMDVPILDSLIDPA